jgi:hypothetical protein
LGITGHRNLPVLGLRLSIARRFALNCGWRIRRDAMADEETAIQGVWLPVIGKALAYLCLAKAMKTEAGAEKYKSILAKAKSLQGLGLPENDAAFASGSTSESVRVAKYKKAKAKKSVKKGKKARVSRG